MKMLEGRQDAGAVPAASTINTSMAGCFYDGGEIGSTGMRVKWSLPDDRVIGQNL